MSVLDESTVEGDFSATQQREKIRVKRVAQITTVVMLALLTIAFIQLHRGIHSEAIVLTTAAGACISILYMLNNGKVKLASTSIVLLLTAMIMILASTGGGLRDVVLHAFPGLIIFSAMLNSLKQTISLTLLIIIFFLTLGVGTELGWWHHEPETTGTITGIFLSVILFVVGFSIFSLHNDLIGLLGKVQDENQRYVATKHHIEHIALHDPLTGLPNRLLAKERFKSLSTLSKRQGTKTALLFIDLDDFKFVNDSSGHEAGDQMLISIGKRVEAILRKSDTVCRFGGDEFLVIVNDVNDERELGLLAKKLIATISEPVRIFEVDHQCSASIGITVAPDDGDEFDGLLKNADMAMYLAKKEGRNNYQFFDDNLQQEANRKAGLVNQMRNALPKHEFALHYQPKIRLSDGVIVGAEALIRWHNNIHGNVSPAELIPLAESSGFIHELGLWVIQKACEDLHLLQEKGFNEFHVGVNVSIAQLKNKALRHTFVAKMQEQQINPTLIDLELTESLLASENSQLIENLDKLRETGTTLSIDDFGTGYSNLGYLKRFEVETLKIDRSFVHDLPTNPNNQAIVRAILQICEELGIHSVAEGVEDRTTADYLKEIGCDSAQGYFWSRPLPIQELVNFLEERKSQV